jgi:hypothetical protein
MKWGMVAVLLVCLTGCALMKAGGPPTQGELDNSLAVDILAGLLNPSDPDLNEAALNKLDAVTGQKVSEIFHAALNIFQALKGSRTLIAPEDIIAELALSEGDRVLVEGATGRSVDAVVSLVMETVRLLQREPIGRGVDPIAAEAVKRYWEIKQIVKQQHEGRI